MPSYCFPPLPKTLSCSPLPKTLHQTNITDNVKLVLHAPKHALSMLSYGPERHGPTQAGQQTHNCRRHALPRPQPRTVLPVCLPLLSVRPTPASPLVPAAPVLEATADVRRGPVRACGGPQFSIRRLPHVDLAGGGGDELHRLEAVELARVGNPRWGREPWVDRLLDNLL